MIDHIRNQTAYIINTSKNKYGDQKETTRTEVLVRFRYLTDIDIRTQAENITADAMIWFSAEENVSEGTIVLVDDKYWRVNRLIKARKMDGEIQFLKALVEKHTM